MGVVSASDDINDTVTQADDCLNQTTDEIQAADDSDVLQVADDDDELSEEGEFLDVSEAYECLNNFRCEEGVWQWNDDDTTKTYFNTNDTIWLYPIQRDAELEETAKIRAKELSQLFDHQRPDGTNCFTVFPNDMFAYGENIAAGYVSCESVTEGWKETDDTYDWQGHRRNMLNPDFNRVGIAAYKINGVIYWVQDFGGRYDPKPVENALFYMENNSNDPYFTVELPIYATGDFAVNINGREILRKSVFQGKANITVYGLGGGIYDVELVYGGDVNYLAANQTGRINVPGGASTSNSFTYLNTLINTAGKEVILDTDYAFDNKTDSEFVEGIIIPEAMTIDGQGHTIDAKGLSRIFLLYKGSKLKNLKLVNGFTSAYGGAVLSYHTAVLENCTFINNHADRYGGAVYAVNQLFDDYSTFINNSAGLYGGALLGEALVSVDGSSFIGNRAGNIGGGIYAQGTLSSNNAYYADNTNLQAFSTKLFIGKNNNIDDEYSIVFANATNDNGVVNLDKDMIATQTILINGSNVVINGNGHSIDAKNRTRIFFITGFNVTITNITLSGGNSIEGGAVFVRSSEVYVSDSTFRDNWAETGAGISARKNVFVSSSSFIDNTANAGGAIFSDAGNVTVTDCLFENDDGLTFGAGAIYSEAMINVTDSTFIGCDGPSYGVMFTNGEDFGRIYIAGSTFINNTADKNGGVLLAFLGAEISGSVFENNSAKGDGGVIYSWGDVAITSSNFTGNVAGKNGGVVYHHGGNTSIEGCVFIDNKAGVSSGAVYGNNIEVTDSDFINNSGGSSNTFSGNVVGVNLTVVEDGVNVTAAYTGGKASSSVAVSALNVTYPGSVLVGVSVENATIVTYDVRTVGGRLVTGETVIDDLSKPLKLNLDAGSYIITVYNADSDDVAGSSGSASFMVFKALSSIDVAASNVNYPNAVKVNISVENPVVVIYVVKTSGSVVVGETVIDDLSKPLQLNLAAGEYMITVVNEGNDNIVGSSASAYFTVIKASGNSSSGGSSSGGQGGSGSDSKKIIPKATKITAAKKTFKVKAKTKKYTIILKSGKKAVKKVKVYLKIKGKTYKATTNNKGKATFKIKLKKKGTFTAKITFKGNKNYKKSSKSVKIKFR